MRATRALALAAAVVALDVGVASAQPTRGFTDSWFWGLKGGAMTYSAFQGLNDPTTGPNFIAPVIGADWLITRKQGGLYVAFDHALIEGSLFVNDSVHPDDECPGLLRSSCRRVDVRGLHRLTVAGMIFPLQTSFMQPYFGLGVNFSHVAAADADTIAYVADFGFPYRNATQFQLINATIQQFRTEASPVAMLGTQLRFPLVSLFGQLSATTATDNFLLSAPGARGFRLSFEAGARYNVGSSIDRMR
jgi:hypothetical protein